LKYNNAAYIDKNHEKIVNQCMDSGTGPKVCINGGYNNYVERWNLAM